jgi:alkylated DNA nucleotide flippase Atl1
MVGKGTMVIATPKIIYKLVGEIPKGKVTTVNLIREKLARLYKTDTACPITTGIFLWIVANAVEEARQRGDSHSVPYWRVLKEGGKLNDKYPGGVKGHAAKLEKEGFLVVWNKTKTGATGPDFASKLYRFA